ncbi:L-lactate dehydrogenase complex protein LldG [Haladaptatus litoreus]|uniref:L-lactate dehydrogenase complex protein LldG n=1 Tax=Haladaptatus litoreus TaxID=553468 RepID=A0A1N7E1A0_9EURY|nr:LUD domain-containing protein [Haladaptatus litoreus]SIR81843.1 L-lactate dehydrogenase complex protein LldG [Haladaptatus litoreus]
MSADTVSVFRDSLRELDVGFTRTTTVEFDRALSDAIVEPVLGTELPFDGVSLPDSIPRFEGRDSTVDALENAKTGVTHASLAIADYGTVVIGPTGAGEERVSLHPDRHVAVVAERDVVPGMTGAFGRLEAIARSGGSAIFATGASATADMGSLVHGVHGPKNVHVILISDR